MSYLETSPNSISTLSEGFLFGSNFELVKRQVDQDVQKSYRNMPAPLSGEVIIGGQASTKATVDKDRWVTVEGVNGPIRIDRTTLTPWQQAWYQANQYIEREDWSNAVESIREAIRLRPYPHLIWAFYTMLGMARIMSDEHDGAIIALNKAVKLNSSDGFAQFALGGAYLKRYLIDGNRSKLRKAVTPLRAAIRLGYNKAHIYLYLGLIYNYLEQWQEAKAAYQKAIELNPTNTHAYYDLAVLYYQQNRPEEAKEIIRRLLAIEPNNESIRRQVQMLLQEQLWQRLLTKGVVKEIRSPITDLRPYRNRTMMTIRGKPLSQLVIEGRR